jgi:hypothetical protein
LPKNPYTSLSVERTRYAKMAREFETVVPTEDSFTEWYMKIGEAAINKYKLRSKLYPSLKIIKVIPNGIIIDDSKTGGLVKVYVEKDKIICAEKNDDYIKFALLSPEFNP